MGKAHVGSGDSTRGENLAVSFREHRGRREVFGLKCNWGLEGDWGLNSNWRLRGNRFAIRTVFGGALVVSASLLVGGCSKPAAQAAGPAMQPTPVQTVTISNSPVPKSDEYTATIKSRRSATLSPQVDGNITQILVKSGDRVTAGQDLMEIDPQRQRATLDSQIATERQKKAVFDYNTIEVDRQRKLFAAGVISRDALDLAEQNYSNSKADYESAVSLRQTQEKQLGYYHIRAPFDGIVGDIPVHLGDYVSPTTVLTTVDENRDFEAYIYIPTERASEVKVGLPVNIVNTDGTLLESTKINFVAPSVDNGLQGILVKAPLQSSSDKFRTAQLVKAQGGVEHRADADGASACDYPHRRPGLCLRCAEE